MNLIVVVDLICYTYNKLGFLKKSYLNHLDNQDDFVVLIGFEETKSFKTEVRSKPLNGLF